MREGRLRILVVYTASIVIVLGLSQLYDAHSRSVADAQWYLLTPPVRENSQARDFHDKYEPVADAPFWNWEIRESYGSRRLCETARARKLAQFAKESESLKALAKLDRCVAASTLGVSHSDYWWEAHPEHLIDRNPPPTNALARLLNHIAADSRTHPGMSLPERLVELWMPLLFSAFVVYGLIEGVASPLTRKDWQSASGAAGVELVLLSMCAFVWFAANSKEPSLIPLGTGALAALSGFWLTSASGELEEKAWCWGCAALKHIRGAEYRCPISRALHPSFSEKVQRLTRGLGWPVEDAARNGAPGAAVRLFMGLTVLSVQDRRHVVLESTHELRCDKCKSDLRRSFRCCNQRLCTDCFIDHVSAGSGHEPPLADSALAVARFFNTSNLETARAQKMIWAYLQLKRDDPGLSDANRMSEALADIDNIKFTICQKCDRTLRHFCVEAEKVLCTDCFLDHCAEIENGSAQPSSQT